MSLFRVGVFTKSFAPGTFPTPETLRRPHRNQPAISFTGIVSETPRDPSLTKAVQLLDRPQLITARLSRLQQQSVSF
jgi:hypothetical protein